MIIHSFGPVSASSVASFGVACVKEASAVVAGVKEVDAIDANRRMAICLSCDNLEKTSSVCKLCDCYMPRKSKWRTTRCGDNKW